MRWVGTADVPRGVRGLSRVAHTQDEGVPGRGNRPPLRGPVFGISGIYLHNA